MRVGVIYINDARATWRLFEDPWYPGVAENVVRILSSFEKGLAERQQKSVRRRQRTVSCRIDVAAPPRYRECNYLRLSYAEPLELNWISFSSRASWERRRDASHFDLFFADLLPSLYAAPTRSTFRDLDRRFVGGDRASSTSSGKRIEMRIDSLNGQFERFPNAQIKGRIKFEVVTCSGVINYHVVFDNLKIYFTKGIMFRNASIKVSFEWARFIART